MSTVREANKLIPSATNRRKVIHQNGTTADIMDVIMYADQYSKADTEKFAASFGPDYEKLWDFVKNNIRYVADGDEQDVKAPRQLWADRVGDCKSFSLFIGSVLKNWNIPFVYRFAAYDGSRKPTHVYVVIKERGREIIMDAVYTAYDKEAPYTYKTDKKPNMAQIAYIRGPQETATAGKPVLPGGVDPWTLSEDISVELGRLTPAQFKKYVLFRQFVIRLEIAKKANNLAQIEEVTKTLSTLSLSLKGYPMSGKPDTINGHCACIDREEARVNGLFDWARNAARNIGNAVSNIVRDPGGVIKNAAGTVANAVSDAGQWVKGAVQTIGNFIGNLFFKGDVQKAAPVFLYSFIKDESIAKDLPKMVQDKRNAANEVRTSLLRYLPMDAQTFDSIVRSELLKKYGKDPETITAEMIAKAKADASGAVKAGVNFAANMDTWTLRGKEGDTFTLTQASQVAYGAPGKLAFKILQPGTYRADNILFGDPAPGTAKSVWENPDKKVVKFVSEADAKAVESTTWTPLANEGQPFKLDQTTNIAWGVANGKMIYKALPAGTYTANNDTFGGDPVPGTAKQAYYQQAASVQAVNQGKATGSRDEAPGGKGVSTGKGGATKINGVSYWNKNAITGDAIGVEPVTTIIIAVIGLITAIVTLIAKEAESKRLKEAQKTFEQNGPPDEKDWFEKALDIAQGLGSTIAEMPKNEKGMPDFKAAFTNPETGKVDIGKVTEATLRLADTTTAALSSGNPANFRTPTTGRNYTDPKDRNSDNDKKDEKGGTPDWVLPVAGGAVLLGAMYMYNQPRR